MQLSNHQNFIFENSLPVASQLAGCLHHLAVDSIIWITWLDAHCPKAIHYLYTPLIYELKVPIEHFK